VFETDGTSFCAFLLSEEDALLPDYDYSAFGSTYALDRETEKGRLNILFRLDDGDREMVTVVAVYLGGALINPEQEVVEALVKQVLRIAPYLAGCNR